MEIIIIISTEDKDQTYKCYFVVILINLDLLTQFVELIQYSLSRKHSVNNIGRVAPRDCVNSEVFKRAKGMLIQIHITFLISECGIK